MDDDETKQVSVLTSKGTPCVTTECTMDPSSVTPWVTTEGTMVSGERLFGTRLEVRAGTRHCEVDAH